MVTTRVSFLLLLGSWLTSASPVCQNAPKRIEWRDLTAGQKSEYIDAVKCLTTKPSRLGLDTSLYEDFPYVHAKLNLEIHFVAQFLPWHRYFTATYESALRNDCSYTGPMPYWNWVLDNAAPSESAIWSATDGFGGNGNGTGFQSPARPGPLNRCVVDGPFANMQVTYRETRVEPHCLNRAWNDGVGSPGVGRMQGAQYTPEIMKEIAELPTFAEFTKELENGPHGAIHQGISGDMGPSTSPNDPIFFLHHSQIDRLWSQWQHTKREERMKDYGGSREPYGTENNAKLSDVVTLAGLAEDKTVEELMSTTNGLFCYTY